MRLALSGFNKIEPDFGGRRYGGVAPVLQILNTDQMVRRLFFFATAAPPGSSLPKDEAMDQDLCCLVYSSRSRLASPEALFRAIDDILAASRLNNAAHDITGALMFNAAGFGQVIEGRRAAVAALFERIQRDSRHGDVTLLAFDPIASRSFPAWSMGFVGDRPRDAAQFANVGRSSGFDPLFASGNALLASMRDLAIADEARKA